LDVKICDEGAVRNEAIYLALLTTDQRTERSPSPEKAHNGAIEAAGLPHLTLHGLRRSFGTLSEWVEVPVGVVAQIQGHKPSALAEKHYRRRPLDLLRMWHDKIESWMLQHAGLGHLIPHVAETNASGGAAKTASGS
jgi:integrase